MGRDAICTCDWNGTRFEVKALIEPPELILRGEIRRRISFVQMRQVRADGEWLRFTAGAETAALQLGTSQAVKWAEALLKPPPGLAQKLGITAEATVFSIGKAKDDALEKALAEAKAVTARNGSQCDLVVARVDTPEDLTASLAKAADALSRGVPIWLVYPKGPGHALNESIVRSAGLAAGVVDTKVVSVSEARTGLRFVKRKK